MTKMDIISSCLVRMANSASSMSKMELTPWDLQMLLLDPIQKGILFHKPAHYQKSLIHHLKNSLSRTLDFFPPLSGRIGTLHNDHDNTASFFIDCNDAGVQFVHSVARAISISDILEPTYIPEMISSFFPLNGVLNCEGVSKPLLAVQVTELVDGIFIACTANHTVVDGISFWHFFNSWSQISRGFDSLTKPPVFERWFPPCNVNPVIALPKCETTPLQSSVPSPLLERVFHFSRESLAKLKSKANVEGISSLQALSAHLWHNTTRCRHSLQNKEARLMMVVGARARIPLPEGYFGNGARPATMAVSEAELLEEGLGFAAKKINEFVTQQTKEEIIKFVQDWVENPILHRKGAFSFSLAITSSPRHDVYGNDFGWGKPIAVRSGTSQKSDGKMTLYPAAEAGGIDVEVCLAPATLKALENDEEFMEAFSI